MIGREDPVRPFELIRWARQQATRHRLKPLEAHVLLVLATYANADAEAWPSIKTLAADCGLRPTSGGTNSAISRAIRGLEERALVWTKQAGRGHPAKRELLFMPSAREEGKAPMPSASAEGIQPSTSTQAIREGGCEPSAYADAKYQKNGQTQLPKGTARGSHPATRMASHPSLRMAENSERQAVRDAIRKSLASTEEAA